MKKSVCGVGIIGFGPVSAARTFHEPLIGVEPRLRLHIVSTLMPDEVRPLLPESVTVTAEVADVLQHPEVDLVVVATPNALHYQFAKQALEAGKHVIVEKPLAITVKEVSKLMDLAQRQGRILTQFHNRRWDGGFLTVKKLLAEQRLGRVTLYEAHYDRWVPQVPDNWREYNKPGAGALYDLGVHLLDQTLALFGRPQAVTAVIRAQREGAAADDYFNLQLDYDGLQVVLAASMLVASPGPRYKVCGTKGAYVKHGIDYQAIMLNDGKRPGAAGWGKDKPSEYGLFHDGEQSELVPTERGSYEAFYAGMAAAVLDGTPLPVPVEDARDIIAIIEAAFVSSNEGRRVTAEEMGW